MKQSETVEVEQGSLLGTLDPRHEGVLAFRGIPYAAAPIGERRWRGPAEPASWTGVRDCSEFGPACPQPKNLLGFDPKPQDEDCLSLNVWTPDSRLSAKLPVMVWIHGGGHTTGGTSQSFYHAGRVAKEGIVAVTINYRLGPFGFLGHPLLSAESSHRDSGNYGFLDQIAALRWIQRNIGSFGGDGGNVTIFGESAGAAAIAAHLVSPLSGGLFHRAIMQSGSAMTRIRELRQPVGRHDAMESVGQRISRSLDCEDKSDVLRCLRSKSPEEILAAATPSQGLFGKGERFTPLVDGYAIPEQPMKLWNERKVHKVPILLGSNADEGTVFLRQLGIKTTAAYEESVRKMFGENGNLVLEAFPAASDADVAGAMNRLITASAFASPARAHARIAASVQPDVYLYQFTRRPLAAIGPLSSMGCYHSLDIVYVLGTQPSRTASNPVDARLSDTMIRYWTNFARTGNPNGEGLISWPAYTEQSDTHLEIGDEIKAGQGLLRAECDLFDELRK